MYERQEAIEALMLDEPMDHLGLEAVACWPSEEAIDTVMYADRGELRESLQVLLEWPVMDAEPNIPLEGPEHDASWSSEVETDQPEGDETDGW